MDEIFAECIEKNYEMWSSLFDDRVRENFVKILAQKCLETRERQLNDGNAISKDIIHMYILHDTGKFSEYIQKKFEERESDSMTKACR